MLLLSELELHLPRAASLFVDDPARTVLLDGDKDGSEQDRQQPFAGAIPSPIPVRAGTPARTAELTTAPALGQDDGGHAERVAVQHISRSADQHMISMRGYQGPATWPASVYPYIPIYSLSCGPRCGRRQEAIDSRWSEWSLRISASGCGLPGPYSCPPVLLPSHPSALIPSFWDPSHAKDRWWSRRSLRADGKNTKCHVS